MPLTELVIRNGGVRDLTPLRGMKLTRLDLTNEPVSDLTPLVGMPLTWLALDGAPYSVKVQDLGPLRGLPLSTCRLRGCELVKDFTPIAGMLLTELHLPPTARNEDLLLFKDMALKRLELANGMHVTDLAPIAKMPLEHLHVGGCERLSDLGPLAGKKLKTLFIYGTAVTDLTPLRGMLLDDVRLTPAKISTGLEILRGMPSLQFIGTGEKYDRTERFTALEFWRRYDAGEFGKPAAARPITNINDPAFQAWMKTVAALPAEKQVEAVSKKLMELNPGFDGKVTAADGKSTPKIEGDVVTELGFVTNYVSDISPVRALVELKVLHCTGGSSGLGKLSDLAPLQEMNLTRLECRRTQVSNLSSLQGMKLTYLGCDNTPVSDLLPLRGMSLTSLNCSHTPIPSLLPLQGMPLAQLHCNHTKISDLSPLKGMALATLNCSGTQVSDLSPLIGMPLTALWCADTQVSDVSPLQGMNLATFAFMPKNITKGLDVIRQMKTITRIGTDLEAKGWLPPTEFWKKYDAGEFGKPSTPTKPITNINDPALQAWMKTVAALPAEKQVEAVSKKLMELNPGFDGKVIPKIVGGVVTEFRFVTDNVIDISPVRALAGLRLLNCDGSIDGKGRLSDLSPLEGMRLAELSCRYTQVEDLSPLKDTPLTDLNLYGCAQVQDLAPLRGMKLNHLLLGCRQVRDLTPLKGMPLTILNIWNSGTVQDLTPLEGMSLTELNFIGGCEVRDLTPLKGMPLTLLSVGGRELRDLTPLRGLKLARLRLYNSQQLRDLTPLQGMPITWLDLSVNCERVQDLTPLQAMTLEEFFFIPQNITKGIEGIRRMKSLKTIGINPGKKDRLPPAEFWKRYDAGEFGSKDPTAAAAPISASRPVEGGPGTGKKPVAPLPPTKISTTPPTVTEEQLRQRIETAWPGLGHRLKKDAAGNYALHLRDCPQVTDLTPLKGMPLTTLNVTYNGQLWDLTLLHGMNLKSLSIGRCGQIRDLRPLQGMELDFLDLDQCNRLDLTHLNGMKIKFLSHWNRCSNQSLRALQYVKLNGLKISASDVDDLTPLKGMVLNELIMDKCNRVSNLWPLIGMPLNKLNIKGCDQIADVTALKDLPLKEIRCDFRPERDAMILRAIKTLETINGEPVAQFWQKFNLPAVTPPPAAAGGANLRPSPIGDRLANAKTTHQGKLKKLKDGLLKNLDKKEAVARATGDKAALERIQQERTNLTTSGAIPKLVPVGDYIRQVRAASVQLESAYGVAIKAYTKAKQDDLAAAVDRELTEFRRHMPHPADAKEFAGKFYKVFNQNITWHEAQATCVELGGHLAVLKSGEQSNFLVSLVQVAGLDSSWLGATDEQVEGRWAWVDGSSWSYANWGIGQPNNRLTGEDYLLMLLTHKGTSHGGKWFDQPDKSQQYHPGFICQWDR